MWMLAGFAGFSDEDVSKADVDILFILFGPVEIVFSSMRMVVSVGTWFLPVCTPYAACC